MRRKSQVAGDLFKGSFNRFKAAVRVDIQRHTGIGVSHQVLQAFYIQPGLLDIGAEGVSQHMRCNARNRFAVRLLKLSLHATHIVSKCIATFGIPDLSRKRNPLQPSTSASTFVDALAFTTRRNAAQTVSVMGTLRIPLFVFGGVTK